MYWKLLSSIMYTLKYWCTSKNYFIFIVVFFFFLIYICQNTLTTMAISKQYKFFTLVIYNDFKLSYTTLHC